MKFKCEKGTKAYNMVAALLAKADEAKADLNKFLDELKVEEYYGHRFYLYGSLEAIIVPGDASPGKGWTKYKNDDGANAYKPDERSNAGKEIRKRIDGLKVVTKKELNNCIGYSANFMSNPALSWSKDREQFIISYPDKWGMPTIDGWVEITTQEYNKLDVNAK